MKNKKIFIVAGGTGGHINAALAIGNHFENKNFKVLYFTGQRYLDYQLYKGKNVVHLNVLGLRYKNPFKVLKSICLNIFAIFQIIKLFFVHKPIFSMGTGGYVCGSVLLVSKALRTPSFILEQNAVMGMTNKILGKIVDKIFVHFKETKGISNNLKNKVEVVGNPIWFEYKKLQKKEATNNVLIFGGSLGATQINEALKIALKNLNHIDYKIIHQTGKNNSGLGEQENYQAYPYLEDMNQYYNWADKIICRAGASTISELRIVAKPTLLIPFPAATDDHQTINAKLLKSEADFTVEVAPTIISDTELSNLMLNFIITTSVHSGNSLVNNSLNLIDEHITKAI